MRGPQGVRQIWGVRGRDWLPGRSSGCSAPSLGVGRSPHSGTGVPGTHSLVRRTGGPGAGLEADGEASRHLKASTPLPNPDEPASPTSRIKGPAMVPSVP